MSIPGEHCERHEREINRLRDTAARQAAELAEKGAQLVALEHDHEALAERLPPDLPQWMGEVKHTLLTLARGQDSVVEALNKGYVTVAEFEPVRRATEHTVSRAELDVLKEQQRQYVTKEELQTFKAELKPVVATFWKAAATIGGAILLALLGLLFKH